MAGPIISEKVLEEIIKAFVSEEQTLPSGRVLQELEAATGKSQLAIKNLYTNEYGNAGGDGDPWGLPDKPVQEG